MHVLQPHHHSHNQSQLGTVPTHGAGLLILVLRWGEGRPEETQQQRECTIRPGLMQCLTYPPSGSLSTPSHLPSCSFSAYCDFTLSKCTAKGPSLVGCQSLVTWLNHDSFPHLSKQCFLGTQHGGDFTVYEIVCFVFFIRDTEQSP